MEWKFRVVIAGIRQKIFFELMLPFNNMFFRIVFLQILYFIVCHKAMVLFTLQQADQFGFFEANYLSSFHLGIHFGAPLLVCFQVNEPYFFIITVPYHRLFRTDHIDSNFLTKCTFHFFPIQDLSVGVDVEKNQHTLSSNIPNALLSLLLYQKQKRVVEGS